MPASATDRRRLRLVVVLLVAAHAVELGILAWLVIGRIAAAEFRDRQARDLACALVRYTPPGTEPADAIREKYACGPYHADTRDPADTSATPSRASSTSPRSTPTLSASSKLAAQPDRAGTSTPRQRETPTQGRTTPAPARAATSRPAPSSSTPRVTPAPTVVSTPGLVCRVVGLPLVCSTKGLIP